MNREPFIVEWLEKSAWLLRDDPKLDKFFDAELTLDEFFDDDNEPRWDRIEALSDYFGRSADAYQREADALLAYAATRRALETAAGTD